MSKPPCSRAAPQASRVSTRTISQGSPASRSAKPTSSESIGLSSRWRIRTLAMLPSTCKYLYHRIAFTRPRLAQTEKIEKHIGYNRDGNREKRDQALDQAASYRGGAGASVPRW